MHRDMFLYAVTAEFDSGAVADEYLQWLTGGHLRDVVKAGARHAQLVEFAEPRRFEVHYLFDDEPAFRRYEQGPAVALRAEGLAKFPPSRGVRMARRTGRVVLSEGPAR